MGKSKIIYGGKVLIDLTADTVDADNLLKGYTAHGADGEVVEGACTFDADTRSANAADSEILAGKTAYVKGIRKTGTMQNNGGVIGWVSAKNGKYAIQRGYHDGSGRVGLDPAEEAKLIATNIRQGVSLFGIVGSMTGSEDVKSQAKSVTPETTAIKVLPDAEGGYNYLSEVTVQPIPYSEIENDAGGVTVTIA